MISTLISSSKSFVCSFLNLVIFLYTIKVDVIVKLTQSSSFIPKIDIIIEFCAVLIKLILKCGPKWRIHTLKPALYKKRCLFCICIAKLSIKNSEIKFILTWTDYTCNSLEVEHSVDKMCLFIRVICNLHCTQYELLINYHYGNLIKFFVHKMTGGSYFYDYVCRKKFARDWE